MTTNSINTYHQTSEMRQTNKQKVFECLKTERNQSRFEIGRKTGLGGFESQRRLSDLMNEGKIIITGSRKHGEHEISLYSVVEQLELFPVEKRPSFAKWVKKEHSEIWEKYRILILKEL